MFYWVSFSGPDGFQGGLIVWVELGNSVVERVTELGLAPEGHDSVKALPLNDHPTTSSLRPWVPERLYSRAEIDAMPEGGAKF